MRDRILAICAELKRGLVERGWRITTPEPFASGILSAIPPEGDSVAMARRLEESGVIIAPREGAVRFSPHFYNDQAEVERILEAIERGPAS